MLDILPGNKFMIIKMFLRHISFELADDQSILRVHAMQQDKSNDHQSEGHNLLQWPAH